MLSILASIILSGTLNNTGPNDISILFFGNSHTTQCNLFGQVAHFLESDGSGRKVKVGMISCAMLSDLWKRQDVKDSLVNGNWDYVVLQAQAISMSHKFDYSKDEGIGLAKLAQQGGAKALYFSEWPRSGIDESDYIYNIYADMAKKSGADVVPVGYSFELARNDKVKLSLWSGDGNHSNYHGAYLGALTFYYWIMGIEGKPALNLTQGVNEVEALAMRAIARDVVKICRANPTKIPTASQWRKS